MSTHPLHSAALALGDLANEVVFVGAATVAYWISQESDIQPRITLDADTVVGASTNAEYYRFGDRLKSLGFTEDTSSGVICRWLHPETRLILDVMPSSESVFGFGGGWQARALDSPTLVEISPGLQLHLAPPELLMAMKIEAFRDRGKSDMLRSHDLEDLILMLAGIRSLPSRIRSADSELRSFLVAELSDIQRSPRFDYAVEGTMYKYEDGERLKSEVQERRMHDVLAAGREL